MVNAPGCELIEATGDGTIRVRVNGVERRVALRGVSLRLESIAAIDARFARLRRLGIAVRCHIAADASAQVEYLAWRDKSGEVWEDLAAALVRDGLAVAAPGG